MEHLLLGTFTPVELSFLRSEGSKNFRSVEHSLSWNFRSSGVNVPRTFVPMKLSYHENEYFKKKTGFPTGMSHRTACGWSQVYIESGPVALCGPVPFAVHVHGSAVYSQIR